MGRPVGPKEIWVGLAGRGPVGPVAYWAGAPGGFSPIFFLSFVFLFYLFSFIYFLLRIYIILVL